MPESDQLGHETRSVHEHETTLSDVMNELRIVKEEYQQLRTGMEGVDARQIEALKTEWAHITTEITTLWLLELVGLKDLSGTKTLRFTKR